MRVHFRQPRNVTTAKEAKLLLPGMEHALDKVCAELVFRQDGIRMAPFSTHVAEQTIHEEVYRLCKIVYGDRDGRAEAGRIVGASSRDED